MGKKIDFQEYVMAKVLSGVHYFEKLDKGNPTKAILVCYGRNVEDPAYAINFMSEEEAIAKLEDVRKTLETFRYEILIPHE